MVLVALSEEDTDCTSRAQDTTLLVLLTKIIDLSLNFLCVTSVMPVPAAARSKAGVCGRSLAGTAGSNPAGDMAVCCECCVLSDRVLCDQMITRPEESYRLWCV